MASYNFDEMIDRRKTDSLKWDIPEGQLPMWVADMDFKTAPEIMDAIKEKADEIFICLHLSIRLCRKNFSALCSTSCENFSST